jgi:hypothetical protein
MAKSTPVAVVKNPILLWLLIHGGDPAPDDVGPIHHLTTALTVHELASRIPNASAKREIQGIAAKEVARLAQQIAK